MANTVPLCTGTITTDAANNAVCSVSWSSAPYSYSASIADSMTVADMVTLSWAVGATLVAAWLYKILGRTA